MFFGIVVKHCDPSKLPLPIHGRLLCTEHQNKPSCVTSCDSEHVLNHVTEYHSIQCGNSGRWTREFPLDYRAKACLSEYESPQLFTSPPVHRFTDTCDACGLFSTVVVWNFVLYTVRKTATITTRNSESVVAYFIQLWWYLATYSSWWLLRNQSSSRPGIDGGFM